MRSIDKLIIYLSRIHPLYYLAAYFMAIPCFGIIYMLVSPPGFYAPYSRYEPAAIQDRAKITTLIVNEIKRIISYQDHMKLLIWSDEILLNQIVVKNVDSVDGNSISFVVEFPYATDQPDVDVFSDAHEKSVLIGISQKVQIDAAPLIVWRHDNHTTTIRNIRFMPHDTGIFSGGKYPFRDKLFTKLFRMDDASKQNCLMFSTCPFFKSEDEDEVSFQRFIEGIKGDPFAVSGQFSRMIYLSAVVITTLGLGDIVPIAPASRLLVATEAVIGIIFAGLFLNALAFRAGNPKS